MRDFRISAVHQPHSPVPASLDLDGSQSRPLKSPTPGIAAQESAERPLSSFRSVWGPRESLDPAAAQRDTAAKVGQQDAARSSSDRRSSTSGQDEQIKQNGAEAQSRRQPPTTAELEQRLAQAS